MTPAPSWAWHPCAASPRRASVSPLPARGWVMCGNVWLCHPLLAVSPTLAHPLLRDGAGAGDSSEPVTWHRHGGFASLEKGPGAARGCGICTPCPQLPAVTFCLSGEGPQRGCLGRVSAHPAVPVPARGPGRGRPCVVGRWERSTQLKAGLGAKFRKAGQGKNTGLPCAGLWEGGPAAPPGDPSGAGGRAITLLLPPPRARSCAAMLLGPVGARRAV